VSEGGFDPSSVAPVLETGVNAYGPHWTPSQHACAEHAYMSCSVAHPGRSSQSSCGGSSLRPSHLVGCQWVRGKARTSARCPSLASLWSQV
jgi:hypothetical protein